MKRIMIVTAGLLLSSALSPAFAQEQPAAATPEPSTNAMVNLIRLLVQQGTITQANGDALLQQAQGEAVQARAASGALPAAAPGTIRVPYIPETVRNQIRDEIKAEVMQQAAFEGWAAPDQQTPGWVRNITLSGDVRFRSQSELFVGDNANDIVDYARINAASGGFDFIKNAGNIPIINTRKDRLNRLKLRARFGASANIGKFATAAFRLATGDDNSPISTNQNLGGGLAKRNVWLDQGYVKLMPTEWVNASFGRFANPFRSTDLLFDSDLNFDGAVVNFDAKPILPEEARLAVHLGAFPLDFGSSDFPNTSITKKSYPAKWLLSGQIEGGYTFDGGIEFRAGAAYHYFRNVQGELSAPCLFNGANVKLANGANDPEECSTDYTRAGGLRKGNTLFFIRNNTVPLGETQKATEKQYLGLVYKYSILDLNASVQFPVGNLKATIEGDYVRNLAFKRGDQCRFGAGVSPVTNVVSNNGNDNACSASSPASVSSGNQGYLVRVGFGYPKPKRWGEWNVGASYRYLQTDAVLDSLTDSDFHLGGTNSKGYTLSGTLGLFEGVNLSARWMSANEVSGRPLGIDVFQFDLSAEF